MEQRLKDLLSDLGRRTLRGVKPCPKCGTYNGTRGFSCKNKSCDVVFKVADERKKKTTEACRIITNNQDVQIYSVRLRDKGPDYRAFVQVTTDLVDSGDGSLAAVQNAHCFVEMCPKSNGFVETTCHHVQATMNCYSEAEMLPLKASLIHSLNFSLETRDELWNLATDQGQDKQGSQTPVVQRVSKTIFVVKCAVSEKFPLGFLHCSFVETRSKSGNLERKFNCPCRKARNSSGPLSDPSVKECIHFHACILAFLSDEKLMNEFSYHIQESNILSVSLDSLEDLTQRQVVVHLEMLPPDDVDILCGDVRVLEQLVLQPSDDYSPTGFNDNDGTTLTLPVGISMNDLLSGSLEVTNGLTSCPPSCPDSVESCSVAELPQIKRGKVRIPALKRPTPVKAPTASNPPEATGQSNNGSAAGGKKITSDEQATYLLFEHWLSSVTERINQTMHYQMSGNPEPLVYQIPHSFFECLRERISSGGQRKKRLPNSTTVFTRKDGPPYATQLTKYSWHLQNPVTVKHVFDTPLVHLELTRSFVENHDGTYDAYIPKNVDSDCAAVASKSGSALPTLKPLELRTYLKIGQVEGESGQPVPFIIDWIPDVLPQSKFGELSIQFRFGHQRHPVSAERSKRPHGWCATATSTVTGSGTTPSGSAARRPNQQHKKMKAVKSSVPLEQNPTILTVSMEREDFHNLKLDYFQAPLNDTEFQELTKSVP